VQTILSSVALILLCMGSAQAQLAGQDTNIKERFGLEPTPFEKALQAAPKIDGQSLSDNPNDRSFNGMFKTDPKLLFGVGIAPGWSLEAGYVNLFDRGFHRIDERDARDTAGALGINGFSTHAAAKYSFPMTERLSAYGKLGIAYSRAAGHGDSASQTGLYTGIGARLQVSERVTVGVEYGSYGAGVKSLGKSNANQLKAEVGITF